MTDEKIEKVLEHCARHDCGFCVRLNDISLPEEQDCRLDVMKCALDYIDRLKAENGDMHGELMSLQAYIDNHEEVWKQNAEIDKAIVRKDTAKEILFELKAKCPSMFEGLLSWIDTKLKHYDVEVDDE